MVLAATRIDGFWHHRLWIFALAGSGIAIKRLAGSEKNRAHHQENNCGRVLHGESQPDAGDNQYYGTKYGPFTATEQRHHKGPGNA